MIPICTLAICCTLIAAAAKAEVVDNAGFFSPDAVQKANDKIQKMRRDTGRELLVETFPNIPADKAADYKPENRQQFFEQWAHERFKAAHVNGVYVLICRDPSSLFVTSGNLTSQKEFTQADDDQLRNLMLPPMKQKQYDEALGKATDFVDSTVRQHQTQASQSGGTRSTTPTPGNESSPGNTSSVPPTVATTPRSSGSSIGIGTIIIFAIIAFIVIAVIRRIISAARGGGTGYGNNYGPSGANPPAGGYGYGNTGGGFGRGLLGGILGGVAGGWLQNRMSHSNYGYGNTGGSTTLPRTNTYGSESNSFPESAPDTSASGGSFGDFGGGGGGGGDAGGGGGGGGDSGSSGGSGGDF